MSCPGVLARRAQVAATRPARAFAVRKPPFDLRMEAIFKADNLPMDSNSADHRLIELLDQIAGADSRALKQLYELTSSRLYGLALRIVREPQWAEDTLQDTFLSVWRSAGSYRASLSPPMAWLGLMVRSRALDLIRRQNAEGFKLTQELDDTLADTLESDMPDPMQMSLASQQSQALHVCLSRLENKQREVVSLAYLRDLSHAELAAQLQLPLGTVKTWIRRGLDQLRTCMARFA